MNPRIHIGIILTCFSLAWWLPGEGAVEPPPVIEVLFSPKGGIEARIVADITACKFTCICEAYTLTSKPIIAALVAAKARGVTVEILLDGKYGVQTDANAVLALKDCIKIDSNEDSHNGISHIKAIILDAQHGAEVIAGSYNWTGLAERANHECIFIIHDGKIVNQMMADYNTHKQHSKSLP